MTTPVSSEDKETIRQAVVSRIGGKRMPYRELVS